MAPILKASRKRESEDGPEIVFKRLASSEHSYSKLRQHLPANVPGLDRIQTLDYPRIPCLLDLNDWIPKHGVAPKRVLATALSDPELRLLERHEPGVVPRLGWEECSFELNSTTCDLHRVNLPLKGFDMIVFSQTLEHLYDPLLALANLYRHLSPGGLLFTSVPTHSIPHMVPHHFSQLTPTGLAVLMRQAGFDVVEVGYWGNRLYLEHLYKYASWPDFTMVGSPIETLLV